MCLLGDKSTSMDCWKTRQEMASQRTRLPHSLRPEFDPRTRIKLSGFHTGVACRSQNTAHKHDDFKRCERNNFLLPARVTAKLSSTQRLSSPSLLSRRQQATGGWPSSLPNLGKATSWVWTLVDVSCPIPAITFHSHNSNQQVAPERRAPRSNLSILDPPIQTLGQLVIY